MDKVRICIIVEGGVVQSVMSDSKDVDVELVDLDGYEEGTVRESEDLNNEYPHEVF